MREGGGREWCGVIGRGREGGVREGGGSEGGREGEEGEGRVWCGVIGRGETVVRGRKGEGGRGKGGRGRKLFSYLGSGFRMWACCFQTWAVVFVHGCNVSVRRWSFLNVGGRPYMGGCGRWVPCHCCVMVVVVGIVVWCGHGAAVR